jgi:tetratricopeptide (TPR) repeat protein
MIDESTVLFQADSYSSIGQHDRAIEMLTAALAEEPSSVRLLVALSSSYSSLRRYAESEEAAMAALAVDPASVEAKAELAWSALQRGRAAQMVTLAEEILAVEPDNPQAHLYVALGLVYGRAPRRRIKDRARAEYRAALALVRSANYFYWAAEIERRLLDTTAAKAHVANGLEIDPTNVDLLKLRADQAPTVEEKISILSGVLATNPFDRSSRESLSEVYRRNRLSKYTIQWGLIFWLTLVAGTTTGLGVVVISVIGWLVALVAWGRKNNATAGIPPEFAAMRKSSFRFGLLTSNLSFWWFITTLLGSILLANDVGGGLFVLLAAMVFWGLSHSIVVANDARNAVLDSPLTAEAHEIPAGLRDLARRRSIVGLAAPLGLIVLAAVIMGLGNLGVVEAQIAVGLEVLCACAGLLYLGEGIVFICMTKPNRLALFKVFARLVVLGGVLGFVLVTGLRVYSAGLAAAAPAHAPVSPGVDKVDPEELERRFNPDPQPPFRSMGPDAAFPGWAD